MKKRLPAPRPPSLGITLLAIAVIAAAAPARGHAQDGSDGQATLMLADPAVSADRVAFAYAGDLWIARHDGSEVRRLTSHDGIETNPRFSPDGSSIAFTGEYDGNVDVFVVAAGGGVPERLTWHPSPDRVQDFTPDGGRVLFASGRNAYTGRHNQFFTVSTEGGHPDQLPIPHGFKATYSPDGSRIAYTPLYEAFNQWKNYRGGTATRIWIYDTEDHSVLQIPRPEGRSNDTDPMWVGDLVYFRSDRNGEFNLFSFDPASEAVVQLTRHEDFPVLSASAGAGRIAYEQAGRIHLLDLSSGSSEAVPIAIATDLIEVRPRYASGERFIRDATLSPSGARAAFEFRGEIVTVPREKGDPRNVTASAEVHDRSPAWSPDGSRIAFFSDQGGEYGLHIVPQDGKGEARRFEIDGAGFYENPRWSPDGTKLSFTDNARAVYWIDVETGELHRVGADVLYGPLPPPHHAWSPDSRWLVFTRNDRTNIHTLYAHSIETGETRALTEGLSEVSEAVFDASGKYLYLLASTDAGPVIQWFAQSNQDFEATNAIYLIVLESGTPSPLAKESDEETPDGTGEPGAEESESGEEEDVVVRIDFEDLDQRILALPLPEAGYRSLQAGKAGQLFYLVSEEAFSGGPATLARFDLDEREATDLRSGVTSFVLSHDDERVLYASGGNWHIASAGGGEIPAGEGRLAVDDIEVRIEPRAEWRQIYDEAWRINRDYFYDPNMHGADWPALKEKYAVFLPHLASRSDLNRLLQWLHSELAVGHHRVAGGDDLEDAERVPGGLLGADFAVEDGRYRFEKVYGGLNWNPGLRSPLTEPGVEVEEGEYLLAVEGEPLFPPENLYGRFENTADKIVEITVGPNPDGTGSRTVDVVPVPSEGALRNRDWVEGNLERVTEATDGRVAYVYVPNTAGAGHEYFKRYFFPQTDREAIIVDERHNGGGQIADYYINILRRPWISNWAMRYGDDLSTPQGAIHGPKVMLIDETAGSGGDLLPWMFRKFELGTLIGRPTWGGLVGVLGFPVLMDGGFISAPNVAIWTEDGFVVENVGVPPDIEVEQLPAEVIAGRDPQLERAIEEVMAQLEARGAVEREKPPYPIRVRRP
ncbi:MAG: PDZ domain-containing protein [Gemmatimonadota bacterium]|nr:PDZ domain-containing protein [Gemmatimonadota bacterium]